MSRKTNKLDDMKKIGSILIFLALLNFVFPIANIILLIYGIYLLVKDTDLFAKYFKKLPNTFINQKLAETNDKISIEKENSIKEKTSSMDSVNVQKSNKKTLVSDLVMFTALIILILMHFFRGIVLLRIFLLVAFTFTCFFVKPLKSTMKMYLGITGLIYTIIEVYMVIEVNG